MKELTQDLEQETAEIVNLLFREMAAIFPAFKQAWPTQDDFNCAKKNWVKAFIQCNITKLEDIQRGLNKYRISGKAFVPTVGEFIEWCKPTPKDHGLPDFEIAYQISIKMNVQFSDYKPGCQKTADVIRHTINQIGSVKYRQMPEKEARKIFDYYYNMACNQYIAGELNTINKALDAPNPQDDDPWKTLKKYGGVLPQYAHLNSRDKAMPVIEGLLKKMESKFINR